MTEKQAIKETKAHWRRMIKWAKKQDTDVDVDSNDMYRAIGEYWVGDFCPLCVLVEEKCYNCILFNKFAKCSGNSGNLWVTVGLSITWGEWVINAERFYKEQLCKL